MCLGWFCCGFLGFSGFLVVGMIYRFWGFGLRFGDLGGFCMLIVDCLLVSLIVLVRALLVAVYVVTLDGGLLWLWVLIFGG